MNAPGMICTSNGRLCVIFSHRNLSSTNLKEDFLPETLNIAPRAYPRNSSQQLQADIGSVHTEFQLEIKGQHQVKPRQLCQAWVERVICAVERGTLRASC